MLGYNLKDVLSIDINLKEKFLVLNLKYLSYRLDIDDYNRLQELIDKLNEFKKPLAPENKKIDIPQFYSDRTKRDV